MILTKDHTPTSFALGTTNSISELAQMVGGAVGSPLIRHVNLNARLNVTLMAISIQLSLRILYLQQGGGRSSMGHRHLHSLSYR